MGDRADGVYRVRSGPAASVYSSETIWLSLKLLLSAAAAAPDLQSTKPDPLEAEAVENNKFDSARFEPPHLNNPGLCREIWIFASSPKR